MKNLFLASLLFMAPLPVLASDGFSSTDPAIRARIAQMMDEVKRLTTPGMGYVSEDPSIRARILAMTAQTKQPVYIAPVPVIQQVIAPTPVVKPLSDLDRRIMVHNGRLTAIREKIDLTFKPATSMADMYARPRCELNWPNKLIIQKCYALMDELETARNASIW